VEALFVCVTSLVIAGTGKIRTEEIEAQPWEKDAKIGCMQRGDARMVLL
jgi:hypothetical protein